MDILVPMRSYKILALSFVLAVTASHCYAATSFKFLNCTVELSDSTAAGKILGKSDSYTKALTPFDVTIRLQDKSKTKETDYLQNAKSKVRSWNDAEIAQLKKSFAEIESALKKDGLSLQLPATIHVIKTTGEEEFGAAGYTREDNIILNAVDGPVSTSLVSHELFHVYSRANEKKRDALYATLGFRKCNPISYNQALQGRGVTNPDCPVVSHYASLKYGDEAKDMILVFYSTEPFTSGNVLQKSATVSLMEVTGDDKNKQPNMVEGKPVMHGLTHVPDLFTKAGKNTGYILHPEEVCAEHFSMLISGEEVKEPEYIEKMKQILR